MIAVLVIGCGNIGALYDIDNDTVKTHCKALSQLKEVNVTIYDSNVALAQKVSAKYGFASVAQVKDLDLKNFQWVVIASSTNTHFHWLNELIKHQTPLIICEKPIAKSKEELILLETLYQTHASKILVNYIRRFHPAYQDLKNYIQTRTEKPIQVIVKYQRGVINNFSHAADLLNYLLEVTSFESVHTTQKNYDEFDDDPTLVFDAKLLNSISLKVIGLAYVNYAYFEIEIFYTNARIVISNSGNNIDYYEAVTTSGFYLPLQKNKALSCSNLLENYMTFVYEHVLKVHQGNAADNFLSTLHLNLQLLNLLS